jgi:hypothetical protein
LTGGGVGPWAHLEAVEGKHEVRVFVEVNSHSFNRKQSSGYFKCRRYFSWLVKKTCFRALNWNQCQGERGGHWKWSSYRLLLSAHTLCDIGGSILDVVGEILSVWKSYMKIENLKMKNLKRSWITSSHDFKFTCPPFIILNLELNWELHSDSRQRVNSNIILCVHLSVNYMLKKT